VVLETDEDRAIAGSDYFVTTIRVGWDHSRVIDEEIARENGVLGQETTGAGGFFMAARSIPALIRHYEKIRRMAPEAWVFNFTNPSGLVTQAMRSLGYDRVIGICDTPSSTKLRIADAMAYDNNDLYMEFFGLNHLSWARKTSYRGSIHGLADDDVVEITCKVDKNGPAPVPIGTVYDKSQAGFCEITSFFCFSRKCR
jgi:6-phospho-beta-glucosidase